MGNKYHGFEELAKQSVLYPQEKHAFLDSSFHQLSIGIPKEIDHQENRVCLTPKSVGLLIENGHQVVLESGAGLSSGYSDNEFSENGAQIVEGPKKAFDNQVIIKIGPPAIHEIKYMKQNATLFSAVKPPSLTPQYIEAINKKKITAVGYEYIEDRAGGKPIVRSMSEIAGVCITSIAGEHLSSIQENGQGIVFGGITGVPPMKIIVIGAGTIGENVVRISTAMGAEVQVYDHQHYKLRRLQSELGYHFYSSIIDNHTLAKEIQDADVVVVALRADSYSPIIVTEDMVISMKPKSLIIDASISQGGCVETSTLTSHDRPTFVKHQVTHYCVPNISSRVGRTATKAFSYLFTPMLLNMGRTGGVHNTMRSKPWFRKGVYTYKGNLTNHSIGNRLQIPSRDLDIIIASC
jgi:alanine dehydrogenase